MKPLRKPWWDTKLSRKFGVSGMAAVLWVDHFFPSAPTIPANDRDHIKW
jgi:hypothetical protein